MQDTKTLYSTVPSSLVSDRLRKGGALALIGLVLVVMPGVVVFPPLFAISQLFLGLFLITRGLISYKKLKKLQMNPYKLLVSEEKLQFFKGDKMVLDLSFSDIESIEYEEKKDWFGIVATTAQSKKLFFPYFKKSCFVELLDVLDSIKGINPAL